MRNLAIPALLLFLACAGAHRPAGAGDAGAHDAGPADAGPVDAGPQDAGQPDAACLEWCGGEQGICMDHCQTGCSYDPNHCGGLCGHGGGPTACDQCMSHCFPPCDAGCGEALVECQSHC